MAATPGKAKPHRLRIVCVSDTHNRKPGEGWVLPPGDILIHAGDWTKQGSISEIEKAVNWLKSAEFKVKIVVAGNHDLLLDAEYTLKHQDSGQSTLENGEACRNLLRNEPSIIYFDHSRRVVEIDGISLNIFGSPFSESHGQEWAFQYHSAQAGDLWAAIPVDTDILITHTPAASHLDSSKHWKEGGCSSLSGHLKRVRPILHVCGHCHEGRGAQIVRWQTNSGNEDLILPWEDPGKGNKKMSTLKIAGTCRAGGKVLERHGETAIVNASIMKTSWGRAGSSDCNKPIVVDLEIHRPHHAVNEPGGQVGR